MKKNLGGKLKLDTETLMPLQADALEGVNGGTNATITITRQLSRLLCNSIASGASKPGGSQ